MSLMDITGNTQTGVIGAILILSVLIPNWGQYIRQLWSRQQLSPGETAQAAARQ
jgi:rhamnose transport system permease protein